MNPPILKTERLVFHPFTPDDLSLLIELHADPEVQRHLGGAWGPADVQRRLDHYVREHAQKGYSKWKVSRPDGSFVGRAGLADWPHTGEVELGYVFRRETWGEGLATEAAQALCAWGFVHLPIDHLIGFTDPANLGSRRVLEKIGMRFLGLREIGAPTLSALYRLDRPEAG